MLINLRTGARCLGLAALLAGVTAAADDAAAAMAPADNTLKATWKGATWPATTFLGNELEIRLQGHVDAYAFAHDEDTAYEGDYYRRETLKLLTTMPIATGVVPGYAAVNTTLANGSPFHATPDRFQDGVELHDAQLTLSGSYKKAIFSMTFDGARNDTDSEIEAWYIGLTGIPCLGTLRLGEVYATWSVAGGPLTDGLATHANSGIVSDVLGTEYLVGLKADNSVALRKDEAGKTTCSAGYEFVVGMLSNEYGGRDMNWDIQASLWSAFDCGAGNLKLALAGYRSNPTGNHSAQYFGSADEVWNADVTIFKGATILPFQPVAESVTGLCLSSSWVSGPLYVGASYQRVETDAPSNGMWVNTSSLLGNIFPSLDWYVFHDTQVSGLQLDVAYSLTGEKQKHGGGLAEAPVKDSGALELVGRLALMDMQDNATDMYNATLLATSPFEAANNYNLNREEGGKVQQVALGLNWYPNSAMVVGLMLFHTEWQSDDVTAYNHHSPNLAYTGGTVPQYNTGNVVWPWGLATFAPPANPFTAAGIYLLQDTIKDEYAVDSVYVRTQVKF